MPASSPSSSDSPTPYREPDENEPGDTGDSRAEGSRPREWAWSIGMFVVTAISVFFTAWMSSPARGNAPAEALKQAGQFTAVLLGILVSHEGGHYVAARIHGVPASPPFFIPMPMISPFGTMGAFIRMRGRIPTRNALLDIGASGPLAGLVVAIPLYLYGAAHSHFVPLVGGGEGITLGESILLRVLDRVAAGPAPAGMQLELTPVAFAAWAGFFVTMINLLPVAQLDGGHVAFSLFGPKQDRYAVLIHRSLLALFFVNLGSFLFRDHQAGIGFVALGKHVMSSMFWLVWFEVIAVLGSLSQPHEGRREQTPPMSNVTRIFGVIGLALLAGYGTDHDASPLYWVGWFSGLALLLAMERKGGSLKKSTLFDHPPTGAAPLSRGRAAIAIVTLVFFALLFMPAPMVM